MTVIGRTGRTVIGLTLALAFGCREAPTEPFPDLPHIDGDPAVRRLEWEAHGIGDYDYRLKYSNEWIDVPEVRVEVRGGAVVRLVEIESGAVLVEPNHPSWKTVDDLFDAAVDLMSEPNNVALLRYDAKYDFVRNLWFDNPGWVDEAYLYNASHFVRR